METNDDLARLKSKRLVAEVGLSEWEEASFRSCALSFINSLSMFYYVWPRCEEYVFCIDRSHFFWTFLLKHLKLMHIQTAFANIFLAKEQLKPTRARFWAQAVVSCLRSASARPLWEPPDMFIGTGFGVTAPSSFKLFSEPFFLKNDIKWTPKWHAQQKRCWKT